MREPSIRRRLWLPGSVALSIFCISPAGAYVTRWVREAPQVFVPLLTALFLAAGAALVAWAVRRLRWDLRRRLPWVIAALGLVALQQLLSDRGSPVEKTVERMHFVLFGGLATSLFWTIRGPDRAPGERAPGGMAIAALALVATTWVAFADELLQAALMSRTGELFDVGLNLFAGMVGLIAALGLFATELGWRGRPRVTRLALIWLVPLPLLAALFLDRAHLGTQIEVEGLGAFRSFFSEETLERLDRARARRWARRLPPQPPFDWWVLQDDFLVEGGWHVQARNRALEEGDLATVWIENTILERFYSSILDTGFPEDVHPYRLKPWDLQRLADAGLDRPGAVPPPAYGMASEADRRRIWLVPSRAQAWGSASLLSLVLATAVAILRARG
ncbi:MAG TPA: hypothetical protein VMV46_19350 [Thermoanaerobaculia bacterium]|nr:hypothetical protein [Thermoanaerobaculia bacterium]